MWKRNFGSTIFMLSAMIFVMVCVPVSAWGALSFTNDSMDVDGVATSNGRYRDNDDNSDSEGQLTFFYLSGHTGNLRNSSKIS
jgi:hypothetical protein